MITAVLAVLVLALLLPLGITAVRQRALLTMAVRNIRRRRAEALLVVGGALLGTAIITSSLVVGDVLEGSLVDVARTQHGPIDLTVTLPTGASPEDVRAAVASAGIEAVEGLLPVTTATVTLAAVDRDTAAPRIRAVELDVDAARGFGSDRQITGLADASAISEGQLLVNARVAERLDAVAGDVIRLHAYGGAIDLALAEVVDEVGLAGYGGAVVAPGTIGRLAEGAVEGTAPPREQLLISLGGGVLDTRESTNAAAAEVRAAVAGLPGVEVAAEKAAVIDDARRDGAAITELFSTVGSFSVLAGILLLVNLFVMLAEERKTELGMLRALGFTRRRLSRAFALEGALYALVAAVLGAVAGIGIGWVVALLAGALFTPPGQGAGGVPLVVDPASLAVGALTGLLVSLVTIWLTSTRIARLNVIRAIRDLPEPKVSRPRTRTLVLAAVGVLLGTVLGIAGYLGEDAIALQLGVPVAAFSAAPLLRRILPERTVRLAVAGVVLGWGLGALPLFPDIMSGLDEAVFVVQGVVLTAGAVALAVALDRVWSVAIERLGRGGGGLSARLGVAYPLARRFRTGMLLGMFSLVIFTVTIIAAVTVTFEGMIDELVVNGSAGYDVVLDSSPSDPIAAEALLAREDIEGVAGLARGVAMFEAAHLDGARAWTISGVDADLLARGTPALFARDESYASDADAYRAVLDDPSLAIVPDGFLVTDMATSLLRVGDTFAVVDPGTGERHEMTIAALSEMDWLGNGALVNREVTAALLGGDIATRTYVAAAAGADPEALGAALDAAFLAHGAESVTFTALVNSGVQQQLGFMSLVQGFLALGLIVGISGLAVVMVRAVRERRQQIGMLRALGLEAHHVRAVLLVEAGLIAVQGTVIGAVLGLITTRQLMAGAEAFGDGQMPFVFPWGALVLIVGLPLAAALAATAWPAARAAAIRPAVVLRAAD